MLEINTKQEGDKVVILLNGKLDVNAAMDADKKFTQIGQEAPSVVIDCADLAYISSAGLRAFQRLRQILKKKDAPLVLRHVRPEVMDVLDVTGLAARVTIEK